MGKRTTKPEPDAQLLDAMAKARHEIEAQREHIFEASSVAEVLAR